MGNKNAQLDRGPEMENNDIESMRINQPTEPPRCPRKLVIFLIHIHLDLGKFIPFLLLSIPFSISEIPCGFIFSMVENSLLYYFQSIVLWLFLEYFPYL